MLVATIRRTAGLLEAGRFVPIPRSPVRHPLAWYVVPLLVLLALGLTVYLGALVFCMVRGMHLVTMVKLGSGGYFLIGCG